MGLKGSLSGDSYSPFHLIFQKWKLRIKGTQKIAFMSSLEGGDKPLSSFHLDLEGKHSTEKVAGEAEMGRASVN